jgi:hypothetical protein
MIVARRAAKRKELTQKMKYPPFLWRAAQVLMAVVVFINHSWMN